VSRSSIAVIVLLTASCLHAQTQSGATFGQIIGLGGTPSDIVLDELRGRLYLVNNFSNRVDIYGIAEKQMVGSISVGITPLAGAMSMDSAYLYVTNQQSSSLSVIDLGTRSVAQTVTLPAKPEGVAVGADGRVLISTAGTGTGTPPQNTLLVFDRTQSSSQQLFAVQTPPPPSTPVGQTPTTLVRPITTFNSKLIRTPDGQFIVGLTNPGQNTYMFVYEVASGVILRSRTVAGQSTVLSMSPDGARFMAGFTMYDVATLGVIGQENIANAPFTMTGAFNVQQNVGGSAFSPDGSTLYSAFNTAQVSTPALRPAAATLLISDPQNLAIRLGIKMGESIISKMVMTSDGANAWGLSESGLIYLPLSTLYDYPILQPETTTVFLSVDECNRGVATARVRVNNLGKGRLTVSVPNTGTALIAEVTSGLVPNEIKFTMEPGRAGVVRQAGTNMTTGTAVLQGSAVNVSLASLEAINIPNNIRVYMNYRNPDQRGVIYPVPTTPNNSPAPNQAFPNGAGNEGLQDMVLDEPRGRLYITNSGYNRLEVFDVTKRKFLDPIPVGQLPHQMALGTDGSTLYVGDTGGESLVTVDLDLKRVSGSVDFPPLPRQGGGVGANPAHPRALAMGLFGLQFVMSNGSQWKLVGNQATVRPANSITPASLPGAPNYNMISSPDNRFILTLAGTGQGYLYDSLADTYVAGKLLFGTPPIQSYYGPLAAAQSSNFLLANGLILNNSLTVIGGAEKPGVTSVTFPTTPGPGQGPVQTVISAGSRNVAGVLAINDHQFARITTPVRNNINSTTTDDARPTLEVIDIQAGSQTLAGPLAENPPVTVFGTQRWNVPARQMVADSAGTIYAITLSGLTVTPVTPQSDETRPQIAAARGIVNSTDGSATVRPGSFITISGRNLAEAAAADSLPAPTVLGGSCITFNDFALPLLQTAAGQIQAQVPANISTGTNVVVVRSLATAQASDPVMISVQRPPVAGVAADDPAPAPKEVEPAP
jgi:YVTN family beta-propeller protein